MIIKKEKITLTKNIERRLVVRASTILLILTSLTVGFVPKQGMAASTISPRHIPFYNNQTLTIRLSNQDLNQLSVAGDKIVSGDCPPNRCNLRNNPTDPSGNILLGISTYDPFTMFIDTEQNHHFSLLVYPKAIPGRTVIFQPQEGGASPKASWAKNDYESMLINLTRAMMNGDSLEGFGYQPLLGKKSRLPTCMRATIQEAGRYNGDHVIGSIQQVCNLGKTTLTLTPNSFYQHGVRSVAVGNQTLQPKECGMVYEIISREG